MGEDTTTTPPTQPAPKKALRGVLAIKLSAKKAVALKQDNGELTKEYFGTLLHTTRAKGGKVQERSTRGDGSFAYLYEIAKMPVYYARRHNAWHLTDATPEEVAKFKDMTIQEIAGEYRKA